MSIPIPDIIYDNAPWIAVAVVTLIVVGVLIFASVDLGSSRSACADIGMLYDSNAHGCVEGVNVP